MPASGQPQRMPAQGQFGWWPMAAGGCIARHGCRCETGQYQRWRGHLTAARDAAQGSLPHRPELGETNQPDYDLKDTGFQDAQVTIPAAALGTQSQPTEESLDAELGTRQPVAT